VVHAFEWWSVQLLGPAARSWTHATIVQALHRKAVVQKEQAEELAQLYELARYAPEATELPPQVWNRARHILCQWAGISPV
jgi:DNA-binding transcriptional regulator YbjK